MAQQRYVQVSKASRRCSKVASGSFTTRLAPAGLQSLHMASPHDNQRACLVYAVLIAQVLSVALATTGESNWVDNENPI